MKKIEEEKVEQPETPDPRKPYKPPTLNRLGSIHELTGTLPGSSPADNDPFTPGSTL